MKTDRTRSTQHWRATRPPRFLTAEWRNLVMLNYAVDPDLLNSYVPDGTELDSYNGKTYVSIVAFQFLNTRVYGIPIPAHRNFEEVNLRFYVRTEHSGELRRAVVFIHEIVPRRAIAALARWLYNENYLALPMRHGIKRSPDAATTNYEYAWGRDFRSLVRATISGEPGVPDPDSLDAFITEHYWGYVRQRDGRTMEYRVEHPRWCVWSCDTASFESDRDDGFGPDWRFLHDQKPDSAFLADGSPVTVYRGQYIS